MKKIITPIVILVILGTISNLIWNNPPEAPKRKPRPPQPLMVEILEIQPLEFSVPIQSQGKLEALVEMPLQTRVAGSLIWVNPVLMSSDIFEKGEVLARLDDTDYKLQLTISEAEFKAAVQALEEEKARVVQAKDDWRRGGKKGNAPALVLRLPQLATAQAKLEAATARVELAKRDLSFTEIVAPFKGRSLRQQVTSGQWLVQNTIIASIFSFDDLQIRLPVYKRDLAFLPKDMVGKQVSLISASFPDDTFIGEIMGMDSSLDSMTQQVTVVIKASSLSFSRVSLGTFFTTVMDGKNVEGAFIIPESSLYQGSYVYLNREGILRKKMVNMVWHDGQNVMVGDGLEAGDLLVLTSLGQVSSGTRIKQKSEAEVSLKKRKGKNNKNRPHTDKPS